jgi:hypothetical protein
MLQSSVTASSDAEISLKSLSHFFHFFHIFYFLGNFFGKWDFFIN